jgi:hypothetical protein
MVYQNLCQAHLHEVGLTKIPGDHDFLNIFFQHDKFQERLQSIFQKFHDRFHDRLQDWQTPPNNSLKLVNFKTYYTKSNLPSFSANKVCNGPATWSILTSHYAWGPVTIYNDFPNTHGTAFGLESRVLTITRSRLLACVWSSPQRGEKNPLTRGQVVD